MFHTEQKKTLRWILYFSLIFYTWSRNEFSFGLQRISILFRSQIWIKGKCLSNWKNEKNKLIWSGVSIFQLLCALILALLIALRIIGRTLSIESCLSSCNLYFAIWRYCNCPIQSSIILSTATASLFSFLSWRETWMTTRYRRTSNLNYIHFFGFINSNFSSFLCSGTECVIDPIFKSITQNETRINWFWLR